MRNISEKLGAMADVSAGTSLLFASHANGEAQKIDDAEPSKSKKHRESAVALQKAANEAAEIPKAILVAAANRDAIKRLVDDPPPPDTEAASRKSACPRACAASRSSCTALQHRRKLMADTLVDMAYTKAELKEEKKEMSVGYNGQPSPYPWGLCIRLEANELDKLGITELPQVGERDAPAGRGQGHQREPVGLRGPRRRTLRGPADHDAAGGRMPGPTSWKFMLRSRTAFCIRTSTTTQWVLAV
jgi:hypothetical protein